MSEAGDAEAFVALVAQAGPKAAALVKEHLADNDDLLLHVLLPDIFSLVVTEFHAGNRALSDRLLALVDDALRDGNAYVQNAVLVSFVEHAGYGEGETPEFLGTWPPGLSTALKEF